MEIKKNAVVSLRYTLKNDAGEVLDSNQGHDPLTFLHGNNQLISGLEEALVGKKTGESFQVSVPPEKAYGVHDPSQLHQVPIENFGEADVKPGMRFTASDGKQQVEIKVVEIGAEAVTVDANHPLAGETLHFDVEVLEVRAATPEEIDHGHVHGPGGHHH
jgi:FKBP-type peptidyl-prolyl cis-trans isomerase SlyD